MSIIKLNLSVIIVEYISQSEVLECVQSIQKFMMDLNYEIFVVTNSEYDDDRLRDFKERLKGVEVIVNPRNKGYAGGVNAALPYISAPYVLILNPDARMTEDGMVSAIEYMDAHPEVGLLGPRVIDYSGAAQDVCRRFPRPYTFFLVRTAIGRWLPGAARERKRYLMEDFAHDEIRDVDWIIGGAMLIRKEAIDDVGPMDERYFLYMEDVDWCHRFWDCGWRIKYFPPTKIIHEIKHESIKGGGVFLLPLSTRRHILSLVKYFMKHGVRLPERAGIKKERVIIR